MSATMEELLAPGPVTVTPEDIDASHPLMYHHDRRVNLLFGPHHAARHISARDHAACGTLLSYFGTGADWERHDHLMLATAHATSRTHRPALPPQERALAGVFLLAGEVAARILHRRIIHQHGPHGFDALHRAIELIWRDDPQITRAGGHPAMDLHRMLTWSRGTLTLAEEHAVRTLGVAVGAPGKRPMASARLASEVHKGLKAEDRELIPQVRAEITDSRTRLHREDILTRLAACSRLTANELTADE
ncbi:hypothetical protein [Streptomyces sp. NPDC004286]|uniref:hypothetical protein n=1 Tax=Streptomyces sp. NPDC004286 TaxID=3364696 RepID=UPI003678DDA0